MSDYRNSNKKTTRDNACIITNDVVIAAQSNLNKLPAIREKLNKDKSIVGKRIMRTIERGEFSKGIALYDKHYNNNSKNDPKC